MLGAVLLSLAVTGVSVVLSEGGTWGWTSLRSLGLVGGQRRGAGRLGAPRAPVDPPAGQPAPPGQPLGTDGRRRRIPHERVDVPGRPDRGGVHPDPAVGRVRLRRDSGRVGARAHPPVARDVPGQPAARPLRATVRRAQHDPARGAACSRRRPPTSPSSHGSLWEAFVTLGIVGLGIGFTFAAMPGFIIRAVPPRRRAAPPASTRCCATSACPSAARSVRPCCWPTRRTAPASPTSTASGSPCSSRPASVC